jgi:hypothetical protein
MNNMSPILRRRVIEETDLDDVVELLTTGFPARSIAWWQRGIERLRRRTSPLGYPRYGRLLETNGRVVGALLTIHAEMTDAAGERFVRCNLSSWYVEGAFAGHAPLLLGAALRDKSVAYINVSPALHTQPIIEAQGFRAFASGSLATVPLLARRRERTRVRVLKDTDRPTWPDGGLVADHAALGCLCLVVEAKDGAHPFVFSAPRRLRGFLPATQLLYCRDISDYVRFAGALGTTLLRHGSALALVDGVHKLSGVPGRSVNTGQRKYVFGSHTPRPGDLAYTELAILG